MNVLIVYASNSGNTMFVAERIGEYLQQQKLSVTVKNVAKVTPAELGQYDVLLFGCCTWLRDGQEGQLMEQFHQFAQKLPGKVHFEGKPCGVFALGRHEYTKFCEAADQLERLVEQIGGVLAIPSLRVDGFPQHQVETIQAWAADLAQNVQASGKQQAPTL
jgi:flavodoxin